jgi:pyrroline-5-carboxylate reductase
VLSVKPRQVMDALRGMAHSLGPNQLLLSVVAGVPTRILESMTPCRVVRAMPNMGIIMERGVTAVAPGSRATGGDLEFVCGLFKALGKCYLVEEQYMNAVTAISGSGPAFIALILEALWEGGLLVGLPTDLSWRLALDTLESSLELLRVKKPWEVVEEVTTPAGVTVSGLRVAERSGLRGIIMEMIESTNNRGVEIGRALLRELGHEGA